MSRDWAEDEPLDKAAETAARTVRAAGQAKQAAEAIQAGDEVEIDFDTGIITDKTQNRQFKGQAFPPFMQKIIAAGGLINYINED